MVITFLPFTDFKKTAACLDTKRLGKQRLETLWIAQTIISDSDNKKNSYPIYRMWENYTNALLCYGQNICLEWRRRGHTDNQLLELIKLNPNVTSDQYSKSYKELVMPSWLDPENKQSVLLTISHQIKLLQKDFDHYSKHFDVELIRKRFFYIKEYYYPLN